MSWPPLIRLRRVESIPRSETLRLTFEVRAGGRHFLAYATALRSGTLVDLQASDRDLAGSTGRAIVDGLIAEFVARLLVHARACGVILQFDRGRSQP